VVDAGKLNFKGSTLSYSPATLVQIGAETGAVVRAISGARYDLRGATVAVVMGQDLYVADAAANAVTEIDPGTGALVKVFSGNPYDFADPDGEATWGDHLYVANGLGESVTDIQFAA
jgi:hypothetical protein